MKSREYYNKTLLFLVILLQWNVALKEAFCGVHIKIIITVLAGGDIAVF